MSAVRAVTLGRLLGIHDNCPGAIRHCLIGMCNNGDDRHSRGECKGQRENYRYLFHDRTPSPPDPVCQNRLGASVT
jgi:hypothetical protein